MSTPQLQLSSIVTVEFLDTKGTVSNMLALSAPFSWVGPSFYILLGYGRVLGHQSYSI